MSFGFGTPSSAPATGLSSGFSFGANKPATPSFGLGTPAANAPVFGTATPTFGSTPTFGATSAASAFGSTPTPAFGASSTPAFGASSATPAFGATSAAPTFGATPAFGAASSVPAFGATATPAFGASSAAPTFGTTSAAPAFGATAAAPAFGATSTAPTFGTTSTALTFGATSAAPAFGATSAAPTFGATSSAPAFGAPSVAAFGATSVAPTFAATSTAPTFGATSAVPAFGATSAAPAFGSTSTAPTFGVTATPAFGATTSSLGTGLGTGLSFGATTTASSGLSFGTTTTTSSGLGGLGGFGFGSTTTSQAGLGTSTTTTSVAPSLGLGGAVPTSGATGSTDGKSEPPKQTKLPNEIATPVESFKEFVRKQKSLSSDIMRISIKPLQKVGREAECTLRAALSLHSETGRCRAQSKRLRGAHAAALAAVETASRPPGLDFEGAVPPSYIKELVSELEQQLITFRRQMEVADKQMQSSPKLLTEQEVTLGIRRMHESLVALAGRLQGVHAAVEAQHEQYLNLRKYILKEPAHAAGSSLDQMLQDSTRKKSKSLHLNESGLNSAVLADPRAALGNAQLAGPTPFTYIGGTMSPLTLADNTGTNWQSTPANTTQNTSAFGAQTDSFQLLRPPGKRGKQ
ncbi:nuclear pore complex protein Nup58-like [Leptidea sinapis]|uniref:Nucleoporin Nup58 n=2 Tax=Leptidea sinapis TaxID=189913 RepID=A0A5E4QZ81_9NEOP|nr:nuclear pore complex protein Nup58-like [Leptidea sinapis]VVD03382.1 unnamed protein product [Leptidea sinapis]